MIDEVELSGIKYPIIAHENVFDGLKTITFSVTINGKTFRMKPKYTSEDLNMPPLFGISAEEELRNIMYFELKAELFGIVYNTTFKTQCDIASQCETTEDLLAVSAHDSVFAAFLYNFEGEQT